MSVARKRAKVKKKPTARNVRKKKKASVNTKRSKTSKPKPRHKVKRKRKPDTRRSEAARRGWDTRRSNQLKREAQTDFASHVAFLRLPQVASQIRDQLIRTNLIKTGMVESIETQMLGRLIVAEQFGIFEETANSLAIEFDWNIQDVYTLWHSP